ncbi:non-ribosomal peptide synthetase [Saccharothrix sp. NRRL B-16314]|uniref:non-ribosomal peptide synthetase n=1 Tax=Saccharothrix sp. NRRL B-16314 TaxID=1463825 RepID=UPI000526DD17|nr:non-ribosomal peptide synthetase [Saccharothrix sp. NRRL B-16314]
MDTSHGHYPLSFEQEQMWFLDQLRSGAEEYLLHWAFRLRGPLDADALRAALGEITARHEVLRTRYESVDGRPVQVIGEPAPVDLAVVDLTGCDAGEAERRAREIAEAEARTPIDLGVTPWRLTLVRLAPDDAVLVVVVHHIAFDNTSLGVLAHELRVLYAAAVAGEPAPLEPLPLQFADFAEWQRERWDVPGEALTRRLDYWRERLTGLPPLDLPADRPRPARWDPTGGTAHFVVPAPLAARLVGIGRAAGATPFMVYLAAFNLLLGRYSGSGDFGVGVSMGGRDQAELEQLIGPLLTTVVLRADLSGDPTFAELLARTRETTLDAFEHRDVPFQRLAAELATGRDLSRNPLFQVSFVVHNAQGEPLSLPGVRVEQVTGAAMAAPFDLSLHMAENADGSWNGRLLYPTSLFDHGRVERMGVNYLALLGHLAAEPDAPLSRAEVLSDVERQRLLDWARGTAMTPDPQLPELFRAQANQTPDAVAVVSGDSSVTYAELLDAADRLAGFLRARGVVAETPVGVALHRGTDLVVALLGTLMAGGVYVPLPPDLPSERLEYVLADSGVEVVLCQGALRGWLPPGTSAVAVDEQWDDIARCAPAGPVDVDPANAAYVIYTSGSTGRPKGVVVPHGGIRNRVLWSVREHRLAPGDRVLQKTTIGFDASVWEFLAPLVCGATVVMAPEGAHRDPAVMVRAVAEHKVTVLQLVPSVLRLVVEEPRLADCASLRVVCSAGEPLPAELAERLLGVVDVELYNTYGPTECSIDATAWPVRGTAPDGVVPIGAPLPDVEVYVVDADDRLVPVGVPGELCVGGAGLARGYAGRGDLTAERFTPHPYAAEPGGRWYRTGDLARWRDDGSLEFVGRLDAQVKVRGVRAEPGEVEAVLRTHPSVAAAVVTSTRADTGDVELVGYVVFEAGVTAPLDQLSEHLAAHLPAALVPSAIVVLDALPLLPNGKVDRSALPDPREREQDRGSAEHVAPRTDTERAVAEIMGGLVGVERLGVDDDFFAVGGHSLLAIRLMHRLRRRFDVELTVDSVLDGRTVAKIAALVESGVTGEPAIVPVPRVGALPTSFGQQRLWFLDQLEPGSSEYLIPLAFRLEGPLDPAALHRAVARVAARHEVLRTRYTGEGGTPRQIVDPPSPVAFELVDLAGEADADRRATAIVEAANARPFDLAREHPLRLTVVRTAPERHLVAITLHHIVFDAWSMGIFLRELNAACAEDDPTPPPVVQYADYAAWQRDQQSGPAADQQLAYWRDKLAGLSPVELITDRPRPAERDPHGDNVVVEVPDAVAATLRELGGRTGSTLFTVLLAAFDVLLGRYTGRTDIAVGTPVAGRTRQETEDLIGFFVNNLVLRTDLGGDPSFTELVERVRGTALDAFANQDVPFEHLVDALRPGRDPSRNPLVQVMFEVQHMSGLLPPTLAGCAATGLHSGAPVSKFDLTLTVKDLADGRLRCWFEYATALFDRETIERIAGHYVRLLESIARDPRARIGELDLLSDAEHRAILTEWPDPDAHRLDELDPPAERHLSVAELFERRAAGSPDAIAVVFGEQEITFADLNARANRLAHHLRATGVGPETVVGSCLERGVEPVLVLLATLKAGGVYVPLDPGHPADRLDFMLADAGAHTVITTGKFADRLSRADRRVLVLDGDDWASGVPSTDPDTVTLPDNLAYIIYTSGSTGRPKGVMISHRAYAHHCRVISDYYGIGPGERVILLSALTFDLAMDQMAVTLAAGGTLVVSDPVFWTPGELPAKLAQHRISVMEITAAYYREMLESDVDLLTDMKLMNVGAEVVTNSDAQRWAATGLPGRFLCNYGPTEATVTCMLNPVSGDLAGERGTASLHIGRPIAGTRVHVLDAQLRPLPVGAPGELCIGGVRLARGYLDRPELTATQFVPDPFGDEPGARLYRTGDLVRYRPDGNVEFLGRLDHQVKIRGLRIELPEIEAALAKHPDVPAAAVLAKEVTPGDKRLVAYLEWGPDTEPDIGALREHLRGMLPEYMVPAAWIVLPALPLTTSKKVDRAALPDPTPDQLGGTREHVPPRDAVEEVVAEVWADVLGVERIGAHDDFFELGGHSLMATRVLARLRDALAVELPLRSLFESTTVADLAAVVTALIDAEIDGMTDNQMAELLSREGVR